MKHFRDNVDGWVEEVLPQYLHNDVFICKELLEKNYLLGKILLAEELGVPLYDVIISGTSFTPKIFCNRLMKAENMISLNKNSDLPYYYGSYEGGKVRGYAEKRMVPQPIYHLDFSSLYPSIMLTFNLSPDTVSFVSRVNKMDLTEEVVRALPVSEYLALFKFEDKGDSINFTYPDVEKGGYTRMITVNILKKPGYLTKGLTNYYNIRKGLKELWIEKQKRGEDYSIEFARQYTIKTLINCFHPSTEVVTNKGVKFITDIQEGDFVMSVDKETGKMDYKLVGATSKDWFDGNLIQVKNRCLNYLVTPNHKFLTDKGLVEAKDLKKYARLRLYPPHGIRGKIELSKVNIMNFVDDQNIIKNSVLYMKFDRTKLHGHTLLSELKKIGIKPIGRFKNEYRFKYNDVKNHLSELREFGNLFVATKRSEKKIPLFVELNPLLEIIGWYIAEGHCSFTEPKLYKNGNVRGKSFRAHLSQKSKLGRQRLKKVLNESKLHYSETKNGYNLPGEILSSILKRFGNHSFDKKIVPELFEYDKKHLVHLFNGLMYGDGNETRIRYNTRSEQLKHDFIRLLYHIGGYSFTSIHGSKNYCLSFRPNRAGAVIKTKEFVTEVPYKGYVHNLTVKDNHTLLAGINKKFQFIPQSTYGIMGSDFGVFTEYLIGPTVTAIGRYCISLVEQYCKSETVCEIDTDGLYSTNNVDKVHLDNTINEKLESIFPGLIQKSYMEVDKDTYLRGYFYKSKNYVLIDDKNKLKVKGNSMKSSRNCQMVKKLFGKIIDHFIVKQDMTINQIAQYAFDFKDIPLEDFALKVTIAGDETNYKSENCLGANLGRQLYESTGEMPSSGKLLYYYVCGNKKGNKQYVLANKVKTLQQLNEEYYKEEVTKVLERFGYNRDWQQRSLFDY
jgi:DNA polymerase elongation subunit (family B)